jgi:hypothetical protein
MKRSWNWLVWAGFAITLLAVLSYPLFFYRFPVTRDIPWVTYVLFVPAVILLVVGVTRAFGEPQRYRGKISGPLLSTVSITLMGLFCYGVLALTKELPSPESALRVGQHAPEFTLADASGKPVALADILKQNRAAVLIFYRGYW